MSTYVGPRTSSGRGYVSLTYSQRLHARASYRSALREARALVGEARAWRLMSPERAAERYADARGNARANLAAAGAARRRALMYAWHWQTGLAHQGSAWDERAWRPTATPDEARAVASYPVRTHVGAPARLAYACCVSSIGPVCGHQRGLVPFGLAADSTHTSGA